MAFFDGAFSDCVGEGDEKCWGKWWEVWRKLCIFASYGF
jgi:hypothetical protein